MRAEHDAVVEPAVSQFERLEQVFVLGHVWFLTAIG
jgi:hypothetical protein